MGSPGCVWVALVCFIYLLRQLSPSVDSVYLSSHVVHFTTPSELRDATSQLSGYATKPSTSTHIHRHTHRTSLSDACVHSKECHYLFRVYYID